MKLSTWKLRIIIPFAIEVRHKRVDVINGRSGLLLTKANTSTAPADYAGGSRRWKVQPREIRIIRNYAHAQGFKKNGQKLAKPTMPGYIITDGDERNKNVALGRMTRNLQQSIDDFFDYGNEFWIHWKDSPEPIHVVMHDRIQRQN